MTSEEQILVTYERPPVMEVACGLHFAPPKDMTLAHLGLFWSELEGFGTCEEVEPIAPLVEGPNGPAMPSGWIPSPRFWLHADSGDEIVQVQRDRLVCNWRRTDGEQTYPRYHNIIDRFRKRLGAFERFLRERVSAQLEVLQYELTYVNHIPLDHGWSTLGDLGSIFKDVSWRSEAHGFLPAPERIDHHFAFPLPSGAGRLHVRLYNGNYRDNGKAVVILESTARGFGPNRDAWFDLAHTWIVRAFEDLTQSEFQKTIWGKYE